MTLHLVQLGDSSRDHPDGHGSAVDRLEAALASNRHCTRQLTVVPKAFALDRGPSGGPEAMALVYADDPFADTFWYAHAMRHPRRDLTFVAVLSRSSRFLNADTVPLLFQRLHHWTSVDPHYQPCSIQSSDDAYADAPTFDAAVDALAAMVRAFDPDLRSGYEGSKSEGDPAEMRIIDVYGLGGDALKRRETVVPTPPPSAVAEARG